MKFILAATLLFLLACNNAEKKDDVKVEGAWKMLSQNLKSDATDTTDSSIPQLKIFTGDHVMYANVNTTDSTGNFGVGHYTVHADTVTEHIIYTSSGASADDTAHTYNLFIEKTANGYKQVIPDIKSGGVHYKLSEEYEKSGDETKTPLDGIWKMTKGLLIKGKDTTTQVVTQYKAIYAGNIIWGHTVKDSSNKLSTGVAFGKFEMSGKNKAKEMMVTSTYREVRGQNFDLDITMNGDHEFTQTLIDKDGIKSVETYQRLIN